MTDSERSKIVSKTETQLLLTGLQKRCKTLCPKDTLQDYLDLSFSKRSEYIHFLRVIRDLSGRLQDDY